MITVLYQPENENIAIKFINQLLCFINMKQLKLLGGIELGQDHIGKTCPYCQFPLKQDSEAVQCPACRVPHHQECWEENGGCTTFGCRERIYQPAADERLEILFDERPGCQAKAAHGGKINKLLATALIVSLLLSVAVFAVYSILPNNRTVEIADPVVSEPPNAAIDPINAPEEPSLTFDPAFIAGLDADYYIDYENGTIFLGDLPIGARVVDPSWEWEFRTGENYIRKPGDITKPVTWLIVARDHFSGLGPHVTLLSEELIGIYIFDNSTNKGSGYGSNHWGESGTANATHGLRPWLNSGGIHSGEGFYQAFSESFKNAVLTTTIPNREWLNGNAYTSSDKVFIPSTTEYGDITHRDTYQIGSVYAYFQGDSTANRAARFGAETWRCWTRSPDAHVSFVVRHISPDGGFYSYAADVSDYGVRPALNLKSDILVSEIRN